MVALSSAAVLPKSSKLIPFNPVLDKFGLLRVGGRLKNSRLSLKASHPLILPSNSSFTRLVVRSSHLRMLHGGTQFTLATIRESYWILRGRSVVKATKRKCLPCIRYRSSSAYQLMGNLPALRVTQARPFLNAGVDYAGPISIRSTKGRGHKSTKGYIAVFVCFAVRAVHLEVVSGYTSVAFIAAYRRFASRRGICATLTSDRGTNFVGADAELRSLLSKASKEYQKLASLLATDGTQWKFGPPAALHFGGLWEAAVKSVKHHLRRIVGDSTLTYEEMTTLCEIEACLNSRPIQPLTDDPDDLSVLTPGHFLIGASLKGIPEPTLLQEKVSLLSRWKLLSQMKQHFWQRWSREYLQQMQSRSKWRLPQPQVQVGDMGLLLNELLPPAKWPLIRVVQVHPGDDGLVRVVTIRTATSTLKRPITKICFLSRAESSQI